MKSKEIGDRIKKILKERQITQRDLSARVNMTQSVISDILNGRRDYEKLVEAISSNLGLSRDFLVTGEENNRNDIIANNNIGKNGLSKEEKLRLTNKLDELYQKHQSLLEDAGNVLKEIIAINRILIVGTDNE